MHRSQLRRRLAVVGLFVLILLPLISSSLVRPAKAQLQGTNRSRIDRYSVTAFSGSFTDVTGDNAVTLSSRDDGNGSLSLPFDFWYDSVRFDAGSTLTINSNGFMMFGDNTSGGCCSSNLGSSSYPQAILPFSYDMYLDAGATAYYGTSGSSPNRVLTIEWYHIRRYGVLPGTYYTNMEVKLYESSNVIEILYEDHDFSFTSGYAGIGLNSVSTPYPWIGSLQIASGVSSTPSYDYQLQPAYRPPDPQFTSAPKSVQFPNLLVGSEIDTECVTVSSVAGGGAISILDYGISGDPDFTIVSGPEVGTVLQDGESAQYCFAFNPYTSGSRNASFTIMTTGTDSGTQTISLTGLGIAPKIAIDEPGLFRKQRIKLGQTASQCFTVHSIGTGPLQLTGVTIEGMNAGEYSVASYTTTPIPVGDSGTVCIRYNPTYEGRPDAQVTVHSDAINASELSFQTFGIGILPHFAFVMPNGTLSTISTLAFDSVPIGQTVVKTQRITNPGSDTLVILRNYKSSGDYDYTLTPLKKGDTILAPGQSKDVSISFTPLSRGIRVATVRFYTNIPATFPRPGQDTSQFVLTIRGTGVPVGQFTMLGTAVDSGIVGVQTCTHDTLVNTGTEDLVVTGWSITGANATEFSVTGVTLPFTLKPGTRKVLNVCVTPTVRGLRTAWITATGSTGGTPVSVNLPLLGFGLEVCASANPMSLFDPTPVLIGQTQPASVLVSNCGDISTVYTATVVPATSGYTVSPAQSNSIDPDGSTSFTVTFAPTAIGAAPAKLHITGGTGVTPMDVSLAAVGGGVVASAANANAGDVMLGECKDVVMAVANTGNVDWTPGPATLTNGDYTVVSLVPTTIAAGGSAQLTLKFCPTKLGTSTTSVSFPSATPQPIGGFTASATGRGIVSLVEETAQANGFSLGQAYPNPTNAKTSIRFSTPEQATVRIELIDVTGQTVLTIEQGRFTAGEHTAVISADRLPSGQYYCVLLSEGTRLVKEISVVK